MSGCWETPLFLGSQAGGKLLNNIIADGLYDVAFELLQRYPELALCRYDSLSPLDVLVQGPSAFPSATHLNFWQRLIYSSISLNYRNDGLLQYNNRGGAKVLIRLPFACMVTGFKKMKDLLWSFAVRVPLIKEVYLIKLKHKQSIRLMEFILAKISTSAEAYGYLAMANILSIAAENGIVEVLIGCVFYLPNLYWLLTNESNVFHTAIENRYEKIFNLICQLNSQKVLRFSRVDNGDNTLHLAAKLPPASKLDSVPGAALQMQRELQWFKAVEDVVDPLFRSLTNSNGKTPRVLFTEEHKDLLEKGEKWMRDTARSCVVVATLIATIAYAAVLTGIPILQNDTLLVVFVMSDVVAFFSSTASLITFLSISSARYAEDDFLKSLPMRLILGLSALFVSIAAMTTAFTATLGIAISQQHGWFIAPIILLACLPATLFALLRLPLLVQMCRSTFGLGFFSPSGDLTM